MQNIIERFWTFLLVSPVPENLFVVIKMSISGRNCYIACTALLKTLSPLELLKARTTDAVPESIGHFLITKWYMNVFIYIFFLIFPLICMFPKKITWNSLGIIIVHDVNYVKEKTVISCLPLASGSFLVSMGELLRKPDNKSRTASL